MKIISFILFFFISFSISATINTSSPSIEELSSSALSKRATTNDKILKECPTCVTYLKDGKKACSKYFKNNLKFMNCLCSKKGNKFWKDYNKCTTCPAYKKYIKANGAKYFTGNEVKKTSCKADDDTKKLMGAVFAASIEAVTSGSK
ncbi:unnamed protein product [Candida verbasci]|uniref:Uncharacterized protein n=1 Tax=Candida verbasci TaxID=1227364 RepID=A0A9W4TUS5_9ASCO|nr:unnamed protein product [Candida verbasci]